MKITEHLLTTSNKQRFDSEYEAWKHCKNKSDKEIEMKSQKFSYFRGDTTVEFVVRLTKDKNLSYGLVTLQSDGNLPLDVTDMPVHVFAQVYNWIQENSDYML